MLPKPRTDMRGDYPQRRHDVAIKTTDTLDSVMHRFFYPLSYRAELHRQTGLLNILLHIVLRMGSGNFASTNNGNVNILQKKEWVLAFCKTHLFRGAMPKLGCDFFSQSPVTSVHRPSPVFPLSLIRKSALEKLNT